MIDDTQIARYSWLDVSDLLLLTYGWRTSPECETERYRFLMARRCWGDEDYSRLVFDAEERDGKDLHAWIVAAGAELHRPPRVYVSGRYMTDDPQSWDINKVSSALHELLHRWCLLRQLLVTPYNSLRSAILDSLEHNQETALAQNIRLGMWWCRRVLNAGGYPYCPWADALLFIAPIKEATDAND